MRKILVIGSPGSGKSTFSLRLSDNLRIPVYHLDNYFWKADKTIIDRETFLHDVQAILLEDCWIIDGNYGSSMAMRLHYSDTVIFLDYDVETCLEGIVSRVGKVRVDIPWVEEVLDPEFYEYVRNFPTEHRPAILDVLKEHEDQEIITLKNRDEGEVFLQALEAKHGYDDE